MNLLKSEGGFALTELLVTVSLLTVVVGASLGAFEQFERANRRNALQNDAQDRARAATEGLAREIRNLADPRPFPADPSLAPAIERAEPHELLFRTVDPVGPPTGANAPNVQRVRYCLESSTNRLWRQVQSWDGAAAPATTSACPDAAYGSQRVAAESVTNETGAGSQAIFSYDADSSAWSSDTQRRQHITSVHTDLRIDLEEGSGPAPARLESGVFLRNANRTPTASFTTQLTASDHRVVLNGSASADPDGETLRYRWTATGSAGMTTWNPGVAAVTEFDADEHGITTFPATIRFCLTVDDARDLDSEPVCQDVTL